MKFKIKTNIEHPQNLFIAINKSVKEFVSKWIVSNMSKKIKFFVKKKKSQEKDLKINVEHIVLDPKIKKPSSLSKQESDSAKCVYCGLYISINDQLIECENCLSRDFLIEDQFAFLKVIAEGG